MESRKIVLNERLDKLKSKYAALRAKNLKLKVNTPSMKNKSEKLKAENCPLADILDSVRKTGKAKIKAPTAPMLYKRTV